MVAEDFNGNFFKISGVLQDNNNSVVNTGAIKQKLCVTQDFKKSRKWKLIDIDVDKYFELARLFNIESVEDIDDKTKKIIFKPYKEKIKDNENPPPMKYKEVLQELDLYSENLKTMIEQILVKVFLIQDLKKLEKADDIQFIMDDEWVYLKCKDEAFRI